MIERVAVTGEEGIADSIRAALADTGIVVGPAAEADLVVHAGDDPESLAEASDTALGASRPAMLVEIGSLGGTAGASIAGSIIPVRPGGPCYRCLQRRVNPEPPSDATSQHSEAMRRLLGATAAVRVRDFSVPDEPIARLQTVPGGYHELLPVPGCPGCAEGDRWASPDGGTNRDLDAAIEAAERAVDELIGIVTNIGEAESIPLPYYLATLGETNKFSDVSAPRQAAGVGLDWNAAFMRGLGEGFERYAAGVYRREDFREATPDELETAVDPAAFVAPADYGPVEEPIPWIRGRSLSREEPAWLPAETVVFPPPTRKIRPAITTGLALGNTRATAIANGLAEVLERDAAMIAWYSTADPVEISTTDETVERLHRLAAVEGLSVRTVLVTQDIDIPVVAAAVTRDEGFPRAAIAAAADLDPVAAVRGAIREALQNWMELDAMGKTQASQEATRIANHARNSEGIQAFVSAETSVDAVDLRTRAGEDLETLVSLASAAGLDPLVVETTTRDLSTLGFRAVRVVVPGAQPLFTGDAYFGTRAQTVPRQLGFEPRLERDPHPFP